MKRQKVSAGKTRKNNNLFLRILIIVLVIGVILISFYNFGIWDKGSSSNVSSAAGVISGSISSSAPASSNQSGILESGVFASNTISDESAVSIIPTVSMPVPTVTKQVSTSASVSSLTVTSGPVSTVRTGWAYTPSGVQGVAAKNSSERITLCNKYDGIWQGDTNSKVVYITMDVGYEYNNNTTKILNIAKEKNFKINFFITGALFKTEALRSLVLRMYKEGHLVANHTWNHPSMPILYNKSGAQAVRAELDKVADAYFDVTGHDMPRFMRPPMGEYSEATVKLTKEMGYKTVFWSFAYRDWETAKQPDPVTALALMMTNLHNGTVFLIHAVSDTNVSILPELIDNISAKGYKIALLSDFK